MELILSSLREENHDSLVVTVYAAAQGGVGVHHFPAAPPDRSLNLLEYKGGRVGRSMFTPRLFSGGGCIHSRVN